MRNTERATWQESAREAAAIVKEIGEEPTVNHLEDWGYELEAKVIEHDCPDIVDEMAYDYAYAVSLVRCPAYDGSLAALYAEGLTPEGFLNAAGHAIMVAGALGDDILVGELVGETRRQHAVMARRRRFDELNGFCDNPRVFRAMDEVA